MVGKLCNFLRNMPDNQVYKNDLDLMADIPINEKESVVR